MRRLRRIIAAGEEGRLDLVTLGWLSSGLGRPLTKSAVRRLIMAGAILVDGRPARRPGVVLRPGATLDARVDERRLPVAGDNQEVPRRVPVLYQDEALIAVAKPSGLPTHATADRSRADLYTIVRRQLADAASSDRAVVPYLGLHHRLDRDTSGVVLFTTLESANASLAAQFAARSIEKIYHAITVRPVRLPGRTWRVSDALAQAGTGRTSRMARASSSSAQTADTSFAILEQFPHALLVEARPHTGRKHQIRAHLSGCRMPIAGDVRYGGPASLEGRAVARPLLHASRLRFTHPLSGVPIDIACDYPVDFRDALDGLRRLDTSASTR